MKKQWIVSKKFPKKFAQEFPEFSDTVLQLLWDRNIRTQEQIKEFLDADYDTGLHDPFLMKDMSLAVERIFQAIQKSETILIYGDYDVDGITSSAIIFNTLKELIQTLKQINKNKAEKLLDIYIPERETEGYGITAQALKTFAKNKPNLIVTVDCGISNADMINQINQLGIDIIITDHHHVPLNIPNALAILNPKQSDCNYPFKELAGVGVAFKLAQALLTHLKQQHPQAHQQLPPGFDKWLLDLVALGTVSDCVALTGENRTLTKYGLKVLNKTKRLGLQTLIQEVGLSIRENGNYTQHKTIDTINISFNLAPRLNAAGRIEHANVAYKLLISEHANEALELTKQLEKNNQLRQNLTEKMIKEIKNSLTTKKTLPTIIIAKGTNWKIGIVGLVAGKLTEEFSRPVLVLTEKENVYAGSGRSMPAFNLIQSLEQCQKYLEQFGGHSQAAGLRISKKKFPKFAKELTAIAQQSLNEKDLIPALNIDCVVPLENITWSLIDDVEKFNPFGYANQKPVFLAKQLEVHEVKAVGNKKDHLRICLKFIQTNGSVKYLPAIGFRLGHLLEDIEQRGKGICWGDKVDIAFHIEVNEWNGEREIQLNLLDIHLTN